ncbi:MAG: FkbM family methyltransferase [Acetobacteraceae bacterium]
MAGLTRLRRYVRRFLAEQRDDAPAPQCSAVKEARYRQVIGIAAARYFIKHERTPDLVIPFDEVKRANQVALEDLPACIDAYLDRQELSEPEFAVFRHFTDPNETIIDVGAHFGYSAASMWRAGSRAYVLSIEPNPWNTMTLQRIKLLRPGRYDYLPVGVGNAPARLRFVTPVVEGMGIGGLCSAAIESEMDWDIPENLVRYMLQYTPDVAAPRLQFAEAEWEVVPLDDLLRTRRPSVPLDRIAAIKLDVEGLEAPAIEGATLTLEQHRPMLMVEHANRNREVVDRLTQLGYRYAEFNDGTVYLTEQQSSRVSGFYLHATRLDDYRTTGLLVAAP